MNMVKMRLSSKFHGQKIITLKNQQSLDLDRVFCGQFDYFLYSRVGISIISLCVPIYQSLEVHNMYYNMIIISRDRFTLRAEGDSQNHKI